MYLGMPSTQNSHKLESLTKSQTKKNSDKVPSRASINTQTERFVHSAHQQWMLLWIKAPLSTKLCLPAKGEHIITSGEAADHSTAPRNHKLHLTQVSFTLRQPKTLQTVTLTDLLSSCTKLSQEGKKKEIPLAKKPFSASRKQLYFIEPIKGQKLLSRNHTTEYHPDRRHSLTEQIQKQSGSFLLVWDCYRNCNKSLQNGLCGNFLCEDFQ